MKIANILFNQKKSSKINRIFGVERSFIDYAQCFISRGDEVLSITNPDSAYAEELKKIGSQLSEIAGVNRLNVFSSLKLATIILKFRPDVIICHSGRALFCARLARRLFPLRRIPTIAVDHGANPKKFLKADYVFTVGSHFSKELVKLGKKAETAFVIPNMLDVPKNFEPLVKKTFSKPIKLGSLGGVVLVKNFDKVLRAMVILRDRGIESNYVIGGVGNMEQQLLSMAKEFGLENNFKILGWIDDKKSFFDSIDIFILPSLFETFGIVLLEAMLYSTPIITGNSWGPNEIIDQNINGLKVSRDDKNLMPKLIADAVEKLIKDEEFAKNLAANAHQKFFENYSAEMVGKRLGEIVSGIVEKEGNKLRIKKHTAK